MDREKVLPRSRYVAYPGVAQDHPPVVVVIPDTYPDSPPIPSTPTQTTSNQQPSFYRSIGRNSPHPLASGLNSGPILDTPGVELPGQPPIGPIRHVRFNNIPQYVPSPKSPKAASKKSANTTDPGFVNGDFGKKGRHVSQALDQKPTLFEEYNKMADKEDREFVKAANENLNTLLIFAGIFAAVNASFILETMKSLKVDPQETTNELLRRIIDNQSANSTQPIAGVTNFTPYSRDIRTNLAFFSSLCTSLAGSFLAVMGKQWLSHYEHEGSLKPPADRARERQRKFQGREEHHLQGVVESLPTLLQLSLFIFLAGLADLLWPLDVIVSSCIIVFSLLILSAWAALTAVATLRPNFPYQTRLSVTLRHIVPRSHIVESTAYQNLTTDISIVAQMIKNTVLTDTVNLDMLADSIEAIPKHANVRHLGDVSIKFHLDPLFGPSKDLSPPKELIKQDSFRSPSMLKILQRLLRRSSAFTPEVRDAIMLSIWHMGVQGQIEQDVAEVVVGIALDVADVRVSQDLDIPETVLPLDFGHQRNMSIVVVSQMYTRLAGGNLDENSMTMSWGYIFRCLPKAYRQDPSFTGILDKLAEILEALEPENIHSTSLASAIIEHVYEPSPTTTRKGFWSLPMLRIIRALFSSTSALQPNVRHSLLFQICVLDWEDWMWHEAAEIIADIMALQAIVGHVERWPDWSPSIHKPIVLMVISYLRGYLVQRKLDEGATKSFFNLLYHTLPQNYSPGPEFEDVHKTVTTFCEPLLEEDVSIKCLATAIGYKFHGLLRHHPRSKPPGHEAFWSISVVKAIRTLFKSPLTLSEQTREEVLSRVWARFWSDARGAELEVMAEILAKGAKEVMKIINWKQPRKEVVLNTRKRSMLIAFLFRELAAMEWERRDPELIAPSSDLLHQCLVAQRPDKPNMASRILQSVARLDHTYRDDAFIIHLRVLIVPSMVDSAEAPTLKAILSDVRQDPCLLQWLQDVLNQSSSNLASGGLGLAICMSLWHCNKESDPFASNDFVLSNQEAKDSFRKIVFSLLRQEPRDLGQQYALLSSERHVPYAQLTWEEAFIMVDRLSSYLTQFLQLPPDVSEDSERISVNEDYKRWCRWLNNRPDAVPMRYAALTSLASRLDEYAPYESPLPLQRFIPPLPPSISTLSPTSSPLSPQLSTSFQHPPHEPPPMWRLAHDRIAAHPSPTNQITTTFQVVPYNRNQRRTIRYPSQSAPLSPSTGFSSIPVRDIPPFFPLPPHLGQKLAGRCGTTLYLPLNIVGGPGLIHSSPTAFLVEVTEEGHVRQDQNGTTESKDAHCTPPSSTSSEIAVPFMAITLSYPDSSDNLKGNLETFAAVDNVMVSTDMPGESDTDSIEYTQAGTPPIPKTLNTHKLPTPDARDESQGSTIPASMCSDSKPQQHPPECMSAILVLHGTLEGSMELSVGTEGGSTPFLRCNDVELSRGVESSIQADSSSGQISLLHSAKHTSYQGPMTAYMNAPEDFSPPVPDGHRAIPETPRSIYPANDTPSPQSIWQPTITPRSEYWNTGNHPPYHRPQTAFVERNWAVLPDVTAPYNSEPLVPPRVASPEGGGMAPPPRSPRANAWPEKRHNPPPSVTSIISPPTGVNLMADRGAHKMPSARSAKSLAPSVYSISDEDEPGQFARRKTPLPFHQSTLPPSQSLAPSVHSISDEDEPGQITKRKTPLSFHQSTLPPSQSLAPSVHSISDEDEPGQITKRKTPLSSNQSTLPPSPMYLNAPLRPSTPKPPSPIARQGRRASPEASVPTEIPGGNTKKGKRTAVAVAPPSFHSISDFDDPGQTTKHKIPGARSAKSLAPSIHYVSDSDDSGQIIRCKIPGVPSIHYISDSDDPGQITRRKVPGVLSIRSISDSDEPGQIIRRKTPPTFHQQTFQPPPMHSNAMPKSFSPKPPSSIVRQERPKSPEAFVPTDIPRNTGEKDRRRGAPPTSAPVPKPPTKGEEEEPSGWFGFRKPKKVKEKK